MRRGAPLVSFSIVAFVALCLIPGSPGSNAYGERTNAPANRV